MRLLGFILFYALLTETFIELMIKAMDMEFLDWKEINSWKAGKLTVMGGILIFHAFKRWVPFLAVMKFRGKNEEIFMAPVKASNIPWFFFSNAGHAVLLALFAFVCFRLNKNAFPLYVLLFAGAFEIFVYLAVGLQFRFFTVIMGKNSIILSRGKLNIIQLSEVKRVEKKYSDELYFIMKDGKVETINYRLLDQKSLNEFIIKLKNNCDNHSVYFGNDVIEQEQMRKK